MDAQFPMSLDEINRAKKQAAEVNLKQRRKDGSMKGDMGKDSFLKLLITQMRHQDPTQPMQDREFISQMAQFSALEQMTNINTAIQTLNRSAKSNEAYSLLGRRVEAFNQTDGTRNDGIVTKVYFRDNEVRLKVNNREVNLSDIHAVLPYEEKKPKEAPARGELAPVNPAAKKELKKAQDDPKALNSAKDIPINIDTVKKAYIENQKVEARQK